MKNTRRLTVDEFNKILDKHADWLSGKPDGEPADFSGCNLRFIHFDEYNLSGANFANADLYGANLWRCVLQGANLSGCDLRTARLYYCDLSGAVLTGADISEIHIGSCNLSGANLTGACFSDCTLMCMVNLEGTIGLPRIVCPEDGSFIGFKKAMNVHTCLPVIVELRILEDAKRSSAFSRKCRCSAAEVVSITDIDGNDLGNISALSTYSCSNNYLAHHTYPVVYSVGDIVSVDSFDDNRWVECSAGIHFFMCRDEAVEYHLSAIKPALRWINSNVNAIDIDAIYSQYYLRKGE